MTNDHRRRPVRHRRTPGPAALMYRLAAWVLLSVAFLLGVTCAATVPASVPGGAVAGLLALGAGHTALGLFAHARRV